MLNDNYSNKSGSGLAGVYRGKVILHLTHGYCKIMIHGVYPADWEKNPENLPKAEQASPIFAGTNNGNGTFSYPNIGSTVWCMFANGDLNYPIYFAAALGGLNAYGQHDIVLNTVSVEVESDEESSIEKRYHSDRHMITSGKTHVEWFENGKISATVEDPIRTDASVVYEIDDDYVVNRPIEELIANKEISNILCLTVLDNHYNNGEISSSTYYYIPSSFTSVEIISGDIETTIKEKGLTLAKVNTIDFDMLNEISSFKNLNNAGIYTYGNLSVGEDNLLTTSTDAIKLSNDIYKVSNSFSALNTLASKLDGTTQHDIRNDGEKNRLRTFILLQVGNDGMPKPLKTEVDSRTSSMSYKLVNLKEDLNNFYQAADQNDTHKNTYLYFEKDKDDDALLTNIISTMNENIAKSDFLINDNNTLENCNDYVYSYKHLYSETKTKDLTSYNEKLKKNKNSDAGHSAIRNDYADMKLYESTKENLDTVLIKLPRTILHTRKIKTLADDKVELKYKNEYDLKILSTYLYEDLSVSNDGMEVYNMTDLKNRQEMTEGIGFIKLESEHHLKKVVNGKKSTKPTIKNDAEASFTLKSIDDIGCTIDVNDKKTNNQFTLKADVKSGTFTLSFGSKSQKSSITIDAKGNMTLNAALQIVMKAPTVSIDAKSLNMKGNNGDCKIKNVSLLNHKHIEMQDGDVVYQGQVSTRIASESN